MKVTVADYRRIDGELKEANATIGLLQQKLELSKIPAVKASRGNGRPLRIMKMQQPFTDGCYFGLGLMFAPLLFTAIIGMFYFVAAVVTGAGYLLIPSEWLP